MITTQSRVLAVAALGVASVVGAVTLLDRSQASKNTAVAEPSVVTSTFPAPTVLATTLTPTTIPVTTVPATTVPPPPDAGCAAVGPSAVLDRDQQRAWLCLDGCITTEFASSTAWSSC